MTVNRAIVRVIFNAFDCEPNRVMGPVGPVVERGPVECGDPVAFWDPVGDVQWVEVDGAVDERFALDCPSSNNSQALEHP